MNITWLLIALFLHREFIYCNELANDEEEISSINEEDIELGHSLQDLFEEISLGSSVIGHEEAQQENLQSYQNFQNLSNLDSIIIDDIPTLLNLQSIEDLCFCSPNPSTIFSIAVFLLTFSILFLFIGAQ